MSVCRLAGVVQGLNGLREGSGENPWLPGCLAGFQPVQFLFELDHFQFTSHNDVFELLEIPDFLLEFGARILQIMNDLFVFPDPLNQRVVQGLNLIFPLLALDGKCDVIGEALNHPYIRCWELMRGVVVQHDLAEEFAARHEWYIGKGAYPFIPDRGKHGASVQIPLNVLEKNRRRMRIVRLPGAMVFEYTLTGLGQADRRLKPHATVGIGQQDRCARSIHRPLERLNGLEEDNLQVRGAIQKVCKIVENF